MIYREFELTLALHGAFQCAWRFMLEPGDPPQVDHKIPPDGTSNLALIRAADGSTFRSLVGPSLTGAIVPVLQGVRYCGLRLRPDAQAAVLGHVPTAGGMAAQPEGGTMAPLWDDLGRLADGAPDWRGTQAAFGGVAAADRAIARAVDALIASGGQARIADLADEAALSERQFRRRFRAACGIGAKQYADVQRARRALILSLDDPDWAGIAAEAGFADQPHLARDMKERFGTPLARVRGYFGGMRHELLAPVPAAPPVRNIQDGAARAA